MNLIDTHAHIYLQDFAADREKILENAATEGINRILMPAIDNGTHDEMLALENGNTRLAMMGLHPCSVKAGSNMDFKEELKIVEQWLKKRKFIAVGEIGLDFYWDKTWINEQYEAFRTQTAWAHELNIPIVIHSRDSIDDCIRVVEENQDGKLRGVFHCFSGNSEQAKRIVDLGFYMGIGGVVTFKNSGLDKVLGDIPMSNIVLETDAPYLTPAPFRGKRNEPAYLRYVVDKIAGLKEISREDVAEITTRNANKLFNLNNS